MTNYKEIKTFIGHKSNIQCLAVLPNNKLASCSYDNTIKIWDLTNFKEINTLIGHKGSVFYLVFLPNENLASGSWDKTIKIWDLTNSLCS